MSDLIDRQAAIEAIETECEFYADLCEYEKAKGLCLALEVIERLPSAQQWIPCSERLPGKAGTYLVTIEGVLGREMSYTEIADYSPDLYRIDPYGFRTLKGCAGFYQYNSEYGFIRRDDVVAWMELPEAYKGD